MTDAVKSFMVHHGSTWLMSLVLAVLVWGVLVSEAVAEREIDIPLKIGGLDPEKIALVEILTHSDQPLREDKIRVVLRGPRGTLTNLNAGSLQCFRMLAMSEVRSANPYVFTIEPDHFLGLPTDVKLVLESKEFRLKYDPYVEESVLLKPPKLEGEPLPGYIVGRVSVIPEKAKVRIGQSLFNSLPEPKAIELRPLSIAKRAEDVVSSAVPQEASISLREKAEVRVSIGIRKAKVELKDVPIRVMFNPGGNIGSVRVEGDGKCTVVVECKDLMVDRLSAQSVMVYAFVDQELIQETENLLRDLQWKVNLPDVEVLEVLPKSVTLKANRKP